MGSNYKCNSIYCCNCLKKVRPRILSASDIYQNRPDLNKVFVYSCPHCSEYVGMHKTSQKPLGTIPTKRIRWFRKKIHSIIDPLWKDGYCSRATVYREMFKAMKKFNYVNNKKKFHIGDISSDTQALITYYEAVKFRNKVTLTKSKFAEHSSPQFIFKNLLKPSEPVVPKTFTIK